MPDRLASCPFDKGCDEASAISSGSWQKQIRTMKQQNHISVRWPEGHEEDSKDLTGNNWPPILPVVNCSLVASQPLSPSPLLNYVYYVLLLFLLFLLFFLLLFFLLFLALHHQSFHKQQLGDRLLSTGTNMIIKIQTNKPTRVDTL